MEKTTRRRWSQFGLKGLFVAVTLLAVFLGWVSWELDVIRQREVLRTWLEERDTEFFDSTMVDWEKYKSMKETDDRDLPELRKPALWQRLLGDPVAFEIHLPEEIFDEENEIVARQFPEANVLETFKEYHFDPPRRADAGVTDP